MSFQGRGRVLVSFSDRTSACSPYFDMRCRPPLLREMVMVVYHVRVIAMMSVTVIVMVYA